MRILIILYLVSCFSPALGQKVGDSKIFLQLTDTLNIFQKVKRSLIDSELQIKDDGRIDTLTTYSLDYNGIHCILQVVINDKLVTISGVYGLKKIDYFGYTQNPNKFKSIIFYKGSKGWKLMQQVASGIGGKISFEQ